jgi:hypothetical protein
MKKWVILLTLSLSACASTGIVATGDGVFMISKESAGCGFASAGGALAVVYKEANANCDGQGKKLETVNVYSKDGTPFVRCAETKLQFRCV